MKIEFRSTCTVIGLLIISAIFIGFFMLQENINKETWNNGYCPTCHQKWELTAVEKSRTYFICPECKEYIEIYR